MSVRTNEESTAKSRLREVIDQQPEDASYDEILRELAFQRMVDRGLADARAGRTVDHEEAIRSMGKWQT